MTRVRRRHSCQKAVYTVAWSDSFAELFRLAPSHWARPERLQVRRSTTGLTVIGQFNPPDAPPAKVTVRFRMSGPDAPEVASESLKQSFLLRGRA